MNRRSAFTFIEMLVAMSIAVGLMLFVNQIVGHSADAVRLGESASQVIESARIITDQMSKDVERMVPPSKGGILIIGEQTQLFRPKIAFRTVFPDASGLGVGSPVTMAGINFPPPARPSR